MSILSAVTTTNPRVGIRAVIAAVEKMGKTTLLAGAPRPLLVPLEQGYVGVQMAKTPMLEKFQYVMQLLNEIESQVRAGQFPYMSLCIDSCTALERLIHQATLETDKDYGGKGNKKAITMESALGGYGKAYQYANELFGMFLDKCDTLSKLGINIILTCHVFAAKVVDPTAGEYDCWDLLLHSPKNQKTYGKREMLTQWADLIGFLHEPMFITEGDRMNKGVSANQGRVLAVSRTPAYVAGNRFQMVAPIPMPAVQGWNHLAHAIYLASGCDYYNRDVPQQGAA